MRRVLIVAPHFPPVNAPDGQRVRMSMPFYACAGWEPFVLTVRAEDQEEPRDDELMATMPAVPTTRVRALPLAWSRPFGIGNVALRAFGALYRQGASIIRSHRIDLVFFSTTMFLAMPLGRLWKRRLGVPYVLDFQDPWFTTYYDDKPRDARPPKHAMARAFHRALEAWTMREVGHVIAVSDAYTRTLRERYPWVDEDMCTTIPFGASERDAAMVRRRPAGDAGSVGRSWRGVSTGRGGRDMVHAATILFRALARAQADRGEGAVHLDFIGTAYASGRAAAESIRPVAVEAGVEAFVFEQPERVPYLESLRRLDDADFLVLLGSDDPEYSASKIYTYLNARRPVFAVTHERSPLADLIRRSGCGTVVTFANRDDFDGPVARAAESLARLFARLPYEPVIDDDVTRAYSADALTRRQCEVFDGVLARASSAARHG